MTTTMMSEEVVAPRETTAIHVLIVDDEPTIREACAKVVQMSGMHATTVSTAEEATEVIENTAIDIVLTDLMLPQTSGLELLKRVHETHPNLPVIVLTQYGTIDSAVAATRMGAIDYVTKPFRIEELQARLERASRAVRRGIATGESVAARAVADEAGIRRADRRVGAHAARVQDDPEGEPARLSGVGVGRERHWQGIGGAQRAFFGSAERSAVRAGGLFIAGADADRVGIVWICERRVHRSAAWKARAAGSRAWRDVVSR